MISSLNRSICIHLKQNKTKKNNNKDTSHPTLLSDPTNALGACDSNNNNNKNLSIGPQIISQSFSFICVMNEEFHVTFRIGAFRSTSLIHKCASSFFFSLIFLLLLNDLCLLFCHQIKIKKKYSRAVFILLLSSLLIIVNVVNVRLVVF